MKSRALVAQRAKQHLRLTNNEVPDNLAPEEVLVKVWYCGICHTDVHQIDNDWDNKTSFYPFIPGHEIMGEVVKVGGPVKQLKTGTVVGVGWQRAACGSCYACQLGWRNLCENLTPTCNDRNGGFQTYVIAQKDFTIAIPHHLQTPEAAPLLCAGITVFNSLVLHEVKPWMRTAVVGLGGLGHLGVQFMAAFGCEVSVVTHDDTKRQDASTFGARAFHRSLEEVPRSSLDFILTTAPSTFDVKVAMSKLRARGKLCTVGASTKDINFNGFDMMNHETSICGSHIGDPKTIIMMLDFAARHNITAKAQIFHPTQANEAINLLRQGKLRYRGVLDFLH